MTAKVVVGILILVIAVVVIAELAGPIGDALVVAITM